MSLTLITPPALEPVTLAEAKAHLKLDTAAEDTLIASLIAAARARAEWHTGRALVTQGWTLWLDAWPHEAIAEIPLPPLQAVTAVALHAPDNVRTALETSAYRVDTASEPGRLVFEMEPPVLRRFNAVEIAFTAGYGSAVPAAVKEAVLEIVAELYTHRGDEDGACGLAAQALLAPYRIFKL